MECRTDQIGKMIVKGLGKLLVPAGAALHMTAGNIFAAGVEVQGLTTVLQTISNILVGASVVVVTIAIMWAGYKVAFAHSSLQDIAKPFLGAILIGAASGIAAMIINAGSYAQ
jgi:type IV secretion system protein VirB2